MSDTTISRRGFLKTGGSLAVAFTLLPEFVGDLASVVNAGPPGPPQLRVDPAQAAFPYADTVAWLVLQPDGITIHTGRVELGTGVQTAMTQIALEELHLELKNVTYIQGDTRRTVDEGFTAGSKTIQNGGPLLRRAAATMYQELLARAATALKVAPSQLTAAAGKFHVIGGNKQVTYNKLLEIGTPILTVAPDAPVASPADYTIVGQSVPRQELPGKVFATFEFVQDLVIPDMLHGRVIRPPGRNAHSPVINPASLTAVQAIPGVVQIVHQGNFIGVVATSEWAAITATRAPAQGGLAVSWTAGQALVPEANLPTALGDPANIYGTNVEVRFDGALTPDASAAAFQAAYDAAPVKVEAGYFTPFQMHASFGPSCAVADVRAAPDPLTGVQATIWSQTQGVYPLRRAIAGLLGYANRAAVHVIYEEGAGCYGHDGADDVAGDAALLSKLCGRPVRVQWSRQDEHGWEPLGPAMTHALKGGVDGGAVVAWDHVVNTPNHNARPNGDNGGALIAGTLIGQLPNDLGAPTGTNASTRNAPLNYTFPNQLRHNSIKSFVTSGGASRTATAPLTWMFLRSTALRSLGGFSNSFANESFLGELAAASGNDDLEIRIGSLSDPRAIAVMEALRPTWQTRPIGTPGVGAGIAFQRYETNAAYVGAYVEVHVDTTTGVISVQRAVISHDCGLIINPNGLINQIEGNVMQGVSRTLYEEVHYAGDRVTTTVWNLNPPFVTTPQYSVIRFDQTPTVETILIDRPNEPAVGAGEPTIGAMGGAIGNAVYHAAGIRLRSLPMTPTKVLAALGAL